MFFRGMLYLSAQICSFAGVPVTMAARRQCFVFCSAGATWFVLNEPSPTNAKPSRLSSCARADETSDVAIGAAIAAAPKRSERLMKSRRDRPFVVVTPDVRRGLTFSFIGYLVGE